MQSLVILSDASDSDVLLGGAEAKNLRVGNMNNGTQKAIIES